MKNRLLAVGSLAILPVVLLAQTPPPAAASATAVTERAFLNQYCVVCHNEKMKKAGQPSGLAITLDSLDTAHIEQDPENWERVVRKVRAGMMPPAGLPRPKPPVFESA